MMTEMNPIDLHCHSTVSDGTLPPAEVVARAAAKGCRLLALTDHDDVSGLAEARAAAAAWPELRLLDGVEISVTWRDKYTLHILGLGIDPTNPVLLAGLDAVRAGRAERGERMAAALAQVGIDNILPDARRFAANPELLSRTHFARAIVERGLAKDPQAVFKKFLVKGKPGYVSHRWASLADAVGWIRTAGGAAVIAHPGRYDFGRGLLRELLTEFVALGGEGLEVQSSSHSPTEVAQYARLTTEFGLLATAGSDFHSPDETWRGLGCQPPLPAACQPLWPRWLPAADATPVAPN